MRFTHSASEHMVKIIDFLKCNNDAFYASLDGTSNVAAAWQTNTLELLDNLIQRHSIDAKGPSAV